MKTFLVILLSSLLATVTFAQSTVTLPATLKETMAAMGQNLKLIGSQFGNPASNDSSVGAAVNLVLLTVHAQTKIPTKISQVDAQTQDDMILKYKSKLSETSVVSIKILAALQAGQNSQIPALLTELKSLRTEGHDEFVEE